MKLIVHQIPLCFDIFKNVVDAKMHQNRFLLNFLKILFCGENLVSVDWTTSASLGPNLILVVRNDKPFSPHGCPKWPKNEKNCLEQRQYKKDSIESKIILVLKLLFTSKNRWRKSAAILKLEINLIERSRSYIVLALGQSRIGGLVNDVNLFLLIGIKHFHSNIFR